VLSWTSSTAQAIGVGVEDMTIIYTGSGNEAIQCSNTYAAWFKGIRFLGAGVSAALYCSNSAHVLSINNYAVPAYTLASSYPPFMGRTYSCDMLILNNIVTSTASPIEADGGNCGDVTAYNFGRDSFTQYPFNTTYDHHSFDNLELWEGNQFGVYTNDNTWGSSSLFTYFRNLGLCNDSPYTTYTLSPPNYRSFQLDSFQRFMNAIGNAWGSSVCTSYTGGISGAATIYMIGGGSPTDALSGNSLMRWGNCDVVSSPHCRFVSGEVPTSMSGNAAPFENTVPSNDNLPCSFYFSIGSSPCTPLTNGGTGLSFWRVCKTWATFPTSCSATQTQEFPIAGPEISGGTYVNGYANDTPAAIAWENLPIDTTYQSSYTIASSSWSGGFETLTVTSLPDATCGGVQGCHMMGAFQLSGVNSACTTGAFMTGANSEILMTGSTATTITYALASNPSLQCTGTFKFPDWRQFDERVYETDSTVVVPPPAPFPMLAQAH
jgi:hypothetical protein